MAVLQEGLTSDTNCQLSVVFIVHVSVEFNHPSLFLPVFSHYCCSYSFSSFCCHSVRKLNLRSPNPRKQTLQSSQSRPQRPVTQRLLPRLTLRSLKWRFPVWEGFWLDLMQMDMMRRYREECRLAVCCLSEGVCHELMFSH